MLRLTIAVVAFHALLVADEGEPLMLTAYMEEATACSSLHYDESGMRTIPPSRLDIAWRLRGPEGTRCVAWENWVLNGKTDKLGCYVGSNPEHKEYLWLGGSPNTRFWSILRGTVSCADGSAVINGRGLIVLADQEVRVITIADLQPGERTIEGLPLPITIAEVSRETVRLQWPKALRWYINQCRLTHSKDPNPCVYLDAQNPNTVICRFSDDGPIPSGTAVKLHLNTGVRTVPAQFGPVKVFLPSEAAFGTGERK